MTYCFVIHWCEDVGYRNAPLPCGDDLATIEKLQL